MTSWGSNVGPLVGVVLIVCVVAFWAWIAISGLLAERKKERVFKEESKH